MCFWAVFKLFKFFLCDKCKTQEVATLVNEEKPAGSYEVIFDGSNLASGVYLYRLSVNDYVDVKKMIILK